MVNRVRSVAGVLFLLLLSTAPTHAQKHHSPSPPKPREVNVIVTREKVVDSSLVISGKTAGGWKVGMSCWLGEPDCRDLKLGTYLVSISLDEDAKYTDVLDLTLYELTSEGKRGRKAAVVMAGSGFGEDFWFPAGE